MSKVNIIGIFDDEATLFKGIKQLQSKNIPIVDVFSPYPVHGLDKALGLKETRIAICAFIYAMIGVCLALTMMGYMMIVDWPMDIGGKPSFALIQNLPAFIPITFECAVLCCAHGMVWTFYFRSKVLPGVTPYVPDYRMTDDKLVMQLSAPASQVDAYRTALQAAGASEVK